MTRAGKIETAIAVTLAIVIGAVIGFLMSSEDRTHLFPGESVAAISQSLDEAHALAVKGDCFKALTPAGEAQSQAENLPSSVDPALKRSLIDGVVTLTLRIGNQCTENPGTGTTGETSVVAPDPSTTTGETGTTPTDQVTGPTGKAIKQPKENPTKPTKPTPDPSPVEPPTPTPPTTDPPVDTGPDSGGISPNP